MSQTLTVILHGVRWTEGELNPSQIGCQPFSPPWYMSAHIETKTRTVKETTLRESNPHLSRSVVRPTQSVFPLHQAPMFTFEVEALYSYTHSSFLKCVLHRHTVESKGIEPSSVCLQSSLAPLVHATPCFYQSRTVKFPFLDHPHCPEKSFDFPHRHPTDIYGSHLAFFHAKILSSGNDGI